MIDLKITDSLIFKKVKSDSDLERLQTLINEIFEKISLAGMVYSLKKMKLLVKVN